MFRADRSVIEAGRNRMGQLDLPFFVREQKSLCALQHAEPAALEPRRVLAAPNSFTTCFNADHSDKSVLQEGMEQANRLTAAADAGDKQVWQSFFALHNLTPRFNADYAVKIADHRRG